MMNFIVYLLACPSWRMEVSQCLNNEHYFKHFVVPRLLVKDLHLNSVPYKIVSINEKTHMHKI